MRQKPSSQRSLALGGLLALAATPAAAYIGPGAGIGAIAVTAALLVGGLLLIVGLVWYPLKRMLKKRGQNLTEQSADGDGNG